MLGEIFLGRALWPALLVGGFFFLLSADLHLFMLDVESQAVVNAHVLIGYPDQSEQRHEIAAPVCVEQFEARDEKKQSGHVMAQTVFAREEIEKFAAYARAGVLRLILTIIAWLTENFFVRNSPGDASHRDRKHKQPGELLT